MSQTVDQDRQQARQVRQLAVVLVATMVLWMGLSWAGGFYGWAPRFAFLIDFLALAGFSWALIVTARIWLTRRRAREAERAEAAAKPRKRQARASAPAGTPWHETLGVARDANAAEIKAAYKRRAGEVRARRDKDQLRALNKARDRGLGIAHVKS